MRYKSGVDKTQLSLLPARLDDYVAADHICRVISAFTEGLDLVKLGYTYAECKDTGRRPYDPRMMLNLYIYGYLHRVRSSRRLRDEAARNVEAMWLMDGLTPDDKTICNFRTGNTQALLETFRAFSLLCRELGLYGRELIATDSVKIRANNNLKHNYNKTVVENELSRVDKKIHEYLAALEEGDREEAEEREVDSAAIKTALERLRQRKIRYEALHARVSTEGEVSTVDGEARMMRSGGEGRPLDICYNVQTVVDSANHLIVDFQATTCSSDAGNLTLMSERAMEVLGVETITVLADKGYYDSEDIAACEERGIRCLIPRPKHGGVKKVAGFTHKDFIYDSERDLYICPCRQELPYRRNRKHISGREYRVYVNTPACGQCQQKRVCTNYRYREVLRLSCQDVLDRVAERTRAERAVYDKRREIVEHPFGTIKGVWGFRQFLCRGKAKVSAETALTYLAYNMRRVFTIVTARGITLADALG